MSNELAVTSQPGGEIAEKGTEWRPSEKQIKLLHLSQEGSYRESITSLTEKAGINRRTFYAWLDKPEFAEWWIASSHKWHALHLPEIHSAGMRSAKGEVVAGAADRKLMLELLDKQYAPRTRNEGTVNHKITWGQEVNQGQVLDVDYTETPPVLPEETVLE